MITQRRISDLNTTALGVLLFALLCAFPVAAQEGRTASDDSRSTIGVVIGMKGGLVFTMPRREFPSLRVGETSTGTGMISSRYAETGIGHRYGLEVMIPFTSRIGLATEVGIQTSVTRLAGDTGRPAVRFDLQAMQVGAGVQGNVYVNEAAFRSTGLRTVYIGGGVDIAALVLANRVEAFRTDTLGNTSPAEGSFQNNDPFRTLVGLRFASGVRYGFDGGWELLGEASYAFALNSLFSSDVVRDNGFTLDNIGLSVGLGYRF